MQPYQLSLLKELITQVAGKNTEVIADILKTEKPINEFKIADKLKLTINQARNILYKLYNQSIVSFARKKDEKKGWYIYFWSLNLPKSLERLKIIKEKELNNQKHLLSSRENRRFYKCPHGCAGEFNEETAMMHEFACQECGSIMQLESAEEFTKEIRLKIAKIEKELIGIEAELKILDTARQIQIEKERLAKKKRDKIKRARLRAKLKKLNPPAKSKSKAKNKKPLKKTKIKSKKR